VNAAYFLAFGGLLFVLTLTLQEGLQQSPEKSGLTFVPQGVGFAIASLIGARLAKRLGSHLVTLGATLSGTACLLLLVQTFTDGIAAGPRHLWPFMALLGVGNGFAIPAMIATVLRVVGHSIAGTAAGALTTSQQISMAFGVAILGTIQSAMVAGTGDSRTYVASLQVTLVIATLLLALAAAASMAIAQSGRSGFFAERG
jgi:MFS family permease